MNDDKQTPLPPDHTSQSGSSAYELIANSITSENYLGQGMNNGVFALTGFGDASPLNNKYVLRVNKSFIPDGVMPAGYFPYSPSFKERLNDFLLSSSGLTPPELLYTRNHVSQPLLGNYKDNPSHSSEPLISIMPRQPNISLEMRLEAQAAANNTAETQLEARENAAQELLDQWQSRPAAFINLFKLIHRTDSDNMFDMDMQLKNIVDDGEALGLVDMLPCTTEKQFSTHLDYKEFSISNRLDNAPNIMASGLKDFIEQGQRGVSSKAMSIQTQAAEFFEACKEMALYEIEGEEQSAETEDIITNHGYVRSGECLSEIKAHKSTQDEQPNSTINADSTVQGLANILEPLHAAIGERGR